MDRVTRLRLLAGLAAALIAGPAAQAAAVGRNLPPAATAARQPDAQSQRMAEWTDGYFKQVIARTHVPGAVVVIVKDGKPIFMKGYGVTTAGGRPIDPQTTLFRLGSITKTLTASVASQLIEERKIDPDSDVNRYLRRVQVPRKFGQPVRINDLLYHMGGFGADLRAVDAATDAQAQAGPAEIRRILVPRVRPPGRYPAYDNNGWGVLGLALADATGKSYRDLVAERVFGPAGMTHSVIGIPPERLGNAARDHQVWPDGTVREIRYSLLKPMEQGAGDASSTGADMARYMIMLLHRGAIDGHQVLSPSVYAAMTDFDAHRLDPALPGLGRALYEDRPAGRHAIRHDGGMAGSAASMVLYPDQDLGVFFAINARPYNPFDGATLSGLARGISMFLAGGKPMVSMDDFLRFLAFHEEFAKRFTPAWTGPTGLSSDPLLDTRQLGSLAGRYVPTSSRYSGFMGNIQVALIEGQQVVANRDGSLNIGPKRYRQVARGVFANPTTGLVAFRTSRWGVFEGPSALWINRKVSPWTSPLITVAPLVLLPLLMLTGLFYGRSRSTGDRRLGAFSAALGVAYLACLGLEGEYANAVIIANLQWLAVVWRLVFLTSLLGLIVWLAALAKAAFSGAAARSWLRKTHFAILSLSAIGLLALAVYWRLLDPFRS